MPTLATPTSTFLLSGLVAGLRQDGRRLAESRGAEISVGPEPGCVDLRLGLTRVVVRVSAAVGAPYPDRPFEGVFTVLAEMLPMASPGYEAGRPLADEVLLLRLLEKAIRRSAALDVESLCLVAGKKCWHVRVDLHVLNDDGGVVDAGCAAVMTGLLHFRIPDTLVAGEEIQVHPVDERAPVPLSVLHTPLCVTFSFFNPANSEENIKGSENREVVVVDATALEEALRDGELTITVNQNREMCQIAKAGGLPMDAGEVVRLGETAYEEAVKVRTVIERVLREDVEKGREGELAAEHSR